MERKGATPPDHRLLHPPCAVSAGRCPSNTPVSHVQIDRLALLLVVLVVSHQVGIGEVQAQEPGPNRLLGIEARDEAEKPELEHPSEHLVVTEFPGSLIDAELSAWQEYVPEVEDISIPASADDYEQPALFYAPEVEEERPLLLVLHSWSTDYLQNIDIPLAQFAVSNEWAFMHPDFRGANDGRPESTASDLVISDMEDALEYARENANVDESRIYLLGYSGGAMNALHLASRHPDTFAGVAAWVPVYDLASWYEWNDRLGEKYAEEIAEACGGVPEEGSEAHDECMQRSPKAHVPDAAGGMRVLIAHGIDDETVPVEQALQAYNDLIEEEGGISQEQIEAIMESGEIPEALLERSLHEERDYPHFEEAEAPVLLHLQSGPTELALFDGEHDMLYRPGLEWLALQERE
ncbi:alpha/beta hydrolase family protein [Billgrantia bachuensis]|uniref:Alpha/beta fold hydrolase n=1 Tax=Billgrantia bachuensis TaxID=2717286 RepID=A0ABX0PM91_9GAMM|nr:alpha/beta fold hydrolase [Halomonas bachuensis]NIC04233.1 alpha/beta fold hydrolase [Halomonas bachuensis]